MAIWMTLLHKKLSREIKQGALEITYPDGTVHHYGGLERRPVRARLQSRKWLRRLILNPRIAFGEAYMEGGFEVENDSIYDLLDLIWKNILSAKHGSTPSGFLRRITQFNPISRARKNVSHHYDIGNDLYRIFLDQDLQYSCAYFERPDMSLEQAQEAKKDLITRKLLLKPHHSVLEIGSGWGGLGLSIAEKTGADVTSITLSEEQLRTASARASAKGIANRVHFQLCDYREAEGNYDRIVSVGMLEHVGVPHYQTYFDQLTHLLKDDGVALIHTIGRPHGPGLTDAWTAKYIFPGGYIPALSELLPAIERAGLMLTDVEVLRLHYAETLRAWRQRLHAGACQIASKYGERFVRMWDVYLAQSELSFRYGVHVVYQLQLSKSLTAVPLTRDYLQPHSDTLTYFQEGDRHGNHKKGHPGAH